MRIEEQSTSEYGSEAEKTIFTDNRQKPAISYFGQFGILMGFTGAGLLIGSLIFIIIWTMMTGGNPMNIERDLMKAENANAARMAQLVSSVFMFFVPVYFYALIVNRKPLRFLGFRGKAGGRQVLLVVAIAALGLLLSSAVSEINQMIPISKKMAATFQKWEDNYSDQVMVMANMKNLGDYLITLIVIALVPAIVEESLFRGGFQQVFEKWFRNPWIAIIITSILFSAVHGSYYGFLSRAALGVILGLLFYYSRNIWLNILAHFLNNGIAVTQLYFLSRNGKLSKDSLDDNFHLGYSAILVTLFAIAVLYVLFKIFKKECEKNGADKIDNWVSPSDNPFA